MKVSKKAKEVAVPSSESEEMESSSSGWNCSVCTLENSDRIHRCAACNVPRPTSTRIPRNSQSQLNKIAREQELIKQKTVKSTKYKSDRMSRLKGELENTSSNSSIISNSSAQSDNDISSSSINMSASKAGGSNEKTASVTAGTAVKTKKTPKAKSKAAQSTEYSQNSAATAATTDDDSKNIVVQKVTKTKFKKKMPVKFFSDYIDYKAREVTCNGVTVVITEFRRQLHDDKDEDNNNSMSKNLNFLNQIPKCESN